MIPHERSTGWKMFFGLLMFLQLIGTAVIWRTYDSIQEVTAQSNLNTYKLDSIVLPRLREYDAHFDSNKHP